MKQSDLELMRKFVRRGDQKAFSELVGRHQLWLFSVARRRLGDAHLAEDAVQAVWILLSEKSAELARGEPASLRAWLFRAVHFVCMRLGRSRQRRQRREKAVVAYRHEAASAGEELLKLLEDAVAHLPVIDRAAVVMRFYEGAEWESVGRAGRTSGEAARKRVKRAIGTIRAEMLRDGFDLIPDELMAAMKLEARDVKRKVRGAGRRRAAAIARETEKIMARTEAIDFAVMSAEFFVRDVEANLEFFEKLGFRRHYVEAVSDAGRIGRASLRGGAAARIWLRRLEGAKRGPTAPGVGLFFWINGGAEGLEAHRNAIAAQGVRVGAFVDDVTLRHFTVRSPDGYSIGFFTSYK